MRHEAQGMERTGRVNALLVELSSFEKPSKRGKIVASFENRVIGL